MPTTVFSVACEARLLAKSGAEGQREGMWLLPGPGHCWSRLAVLTAGSDGAWME